MKKEKNYLYNKQKNYNNSSKKEMKLSHIGKMIAIN